jgi:hypothetical protein
VFGEIPQAIFVEIGGVATHGFQHVRFIPCAWSC